MTKEEKIAIQTFKEEGKTTAEIADTLKLSYGSVKTLLSKKGKNRICLNCGTVVEQTEHARAKKFCSNVCWFTWRSHHSDRTVPRYSKTVVCMECGKTFISSRSQERKCCCREFIMRRGSDNI